MTATRWWVRIAARWLARIDGVSGQIRLFSLAVTAFSTFSLVLQNVGLGSLVPYVGVAGVSGGLVYAYLYTEGGVWNQVARDRQDMAGNFAGPSVAIDDTVIGVATFAAIHGRKPDAEERAVIADAVREQWDDLRDGIQIET